MLLRASEAGNPLASAFPSHGKSWWPLVEDVFNSPAVLGVAEALIEEAVSNGELEFISVDATLRCCMPILGQASYRAPAAVRAAAAFDDGASKRRVLSVRGRTSAVVGLWPIANEDAGGIAEALVSRLKEPWRKQVRHVAVDSPSVKMFTTLQTACSNLQSLCLDPVHLAITYEYAMWRKRSNGSRLLRSILRKFTRFDSECTVEAWGPMYTGAQARPLNQKENAARKKILDGSMSVCRARLVVNRIDSDLPFYSRFAFIEALAALSALHWDEMQRKAGV